MRRSAMSPVDGPAGTDDLAAGGGLELPGREPHPEAAGHRRADEARELIPGERETDTITHREPGAMGAPFNEGGLLSSRRDWLSEDTAIERAREGGGGDAQLAKKRLHREEP